MLADLPASGAMNARSASSWLVTLSTNIRVYGRYGSIEIRRQNDICVVEQKLAGDRIRLVTNLS